MLHKSSKNADRRRFPSNISIDKVSLLSIRPPKLLFNRKLKDYIAFFVRDKTRIHSNKVVPILSLDPRPWLDGTNSKIKLRSSALRELQVWFTQFTGFNDPRVAEFENVLRNLNKNFREIYVADSTMLSAGPAEIVFSKVYPKNHFKFLLQLLHTMGCFDTELDLFSSSSLRNCFVTAGIIPQKAQYDKTDTHHLLKRYILEVNLHSRRQRFLLFAFGFCSRSNSRSSFEGQHC